ncbi:MAG: YnbE family lipoprotein [Alphaproteobacteria bacterium]|nr:YnbE family lipoprotein [Alphaproteobacteria bacterium]
MKKIGTLLLTVFFLSACSPTVKLQAPEKPIEINLNVNIEQHVKISIDKDVKQAISKNKDIF